MVLQKRQEKRMKPLFITQLNNWKMYHICCWMHGGQIISKMSCLHLQLIGQQKETHAWRHVPLIWCWQTCLAYSMAAATPIVLAAYYGTSYWQSIWPILLPPCLGQASPGCLPYHSGTLMMVSPSPGTSHNFLTNHLSTVIWKNIF